MFHDELQAAKSTFPLVGSPTSSLNTHHSPVDQEDYERHLGHGDSPVACRHGDPDGLEARADLLSHGDLVSNYGKLMNIGGNKMKSGMVNTSTAI